MDSTPTTPPPPAAERPAGAPLSLRPERAPAAAPASPTDAPKGARQAPPQAPTPPAGSAAGADRWLRRFRALLVGVLGGVVAGIGALAFYTSFEAIKSYANSSKGIDPKHDWAIPLLVDSFIVVATGADLWFTTTDRRRRLWEIWWPKALLAGAAGVSFTLNVAHVKGHDWAARGVAAIPPAALILGVELLMQVLRRATALRTERLAATSAAAEDELQPAKLEVSRTDAPPSPAVSSGAVGELSPPPKARSSTRTKRGQGARAKRGRAAPKVTQIRAEVNAARNAGIDPAPAAIVHALAERGVHVDRSQVWREINAPSSANGNAPAPLSQEGGRPS